MVTRIGLLLLAILLFCLGLSIVLFDSMGQWIADHFGMWLALRMQDLVQWLGAYRMPAGGGMVAGALALISATMSLMIIRMRESKAPYRVESPFISAIVNPVTHEVDGEILRGEFKGSSIRMLPLFYLRKVMEEMGGRDPEGLRVIEIMLDHYEPQWRSSEANKKHDDKLDLKNLFGDHPEKPSPGPAKPAEPAGMTRDQALSVLGLTGSPDPEAIKVAYRNLMMKIHPDQGGSSYLAAQLNEAKSILLR